MHRIKEKDMQSIQKKAPLANNHISVDCVVIGFDGEQLKVLLVKRAGEDNGEVYHDMKLPGSLIYMDEDLDEAAQRVLYELTGLRNVNLMQFKAFGSKNRTSNPKDVRWLERAMQSKVERIVTIAYLSMVKIDRALDKNLDDHQACWIALKDVMTLAFDHNLIIKEAMTYIRQFVEFNPSMLFELLPRKFTAAQLRTLFIFCQKCIHLIRIHFRKNQHFCRKFRTVIFFCFSGKSLYLRQSAQFLGIILAGNIYDTDA